MKRNIKVLYIFLFMVFCLLPSAGLLFGKSEVSTENRNLSEFPEIRVDGKWNINYLEELGACFQDHFAFRNELVTANACVMDRIGGISAADSVINGRDGWLYYRDSLEDYQGTNLLSDRALYDIAHTLSMIQKYTLDYGIRFTFAVAPNKNSLYSEYMPYYLKKKVTEENNYSRLIPFLQQEEVNYSDLHALFADSDEILYHKRDSHWNNKGAAMAAAAIMQSIGQPYVDYQDAEYEIRRDFEGDLDKMLYPDAVTPEDEIYYLPAPEFLYITPTESNFDPSIETESIGEGRLVMYRDSFGNALLPYFAESFQTAFFSRGIPYDLSDLYLYDADTLIIERAERFLPDMAAEAPVMAAPLILPDGKEIQADDYVTDLSIDEYGPYTCITGTLDNTVLNTDTRIYVVTDSGMFYEACPVHMMTGEEGFSACLAIPTDSAGIYLSDMAERDF